MRRPVGEVLQESLHDGPREPANFHPLLFLADLYGQGSESPLDGPQWRGYSSPKTCVGVNLEADCLADG
eukprot:9222614-Alexandrium_andersonii.AAC.1